MSEIIRNWKKRVTDADQNSTAALPHAAKAMDELSKPAQKWNELERRLRELGAESGSWLNCFKTILVKQTDTDKVLRGDIEQSVSAFDGFVSLLGGDLIDLFSVYLEKAYSDN